MKTQTRLGQPPRWIPSKPRIPSTRRGLEPITPAYVPAAPKKPQASQSS